MHEVLWDSDCNDIFIFIFDRGLLISKIVQSLSTMFGSKECRILILGLDNAGKTTILNRLQNDSDEVMQTVPTIG